eukprot:9814854-Alexandrium_andersonii.AAC.1
MHLTALGERTQGRATPMSSDGARPAQGRLRTHGRTLLQLAGPRTRQRERPRSSSMGADSRSLTLPSVGAPSERGL